MTMSSVVRSGSKFAIKCQSCFAVGSASPAISQPASQRDFLDAHPHDQERRRRLARVSPFWSTPYRIVVSKPTMSIVTMPVDASSFIRRPLFAAAMPADDRNPQVRLAGVRRRRTFCTPIEFRASAAANMLAPPAILACGFSRLIVYQSMHAIEHHRDRSIGEFPGNVGSCPARQAAQYAPDRRPSTAVS